MASVLDSKLQVGAGLQTTLRELFDNRPTICRPEMDFDFSLGNNTNAASISDINKVLGEQDIDGISVYRSGPEQMQQIEGLMTGSIDLFFIFDKKVYVLDYKSNTLGKGPAAYGQESMTRAMQDNRYNLQYLIYTVAADRYMKSRLGSCYAYDGKDENEEAEYSFGGVFYLFLRGMGLEEYPGHGVWFHRPDASAIQNLDNAFKGGGS
jgi:exodeoxyribonuclease V beta subunit